MAGLIFCISIVILKWVLGTAILLHRVCFFIWHPLNNFSVGPTPSHVVKTWNNAQRNFLTCLILITFYICNQDNIMPPEGCTDTENPCYKTGAMIMEVTTELPVPEMHLFPPFSYFSSTFHFCYDRGRKRGTLEDHNSLYIYIYNKFNFNKCLKDVKIQPMVPPG